MAPTVKQQLGAAGEKLVVKHVRCPGCKRQQKTLRLLPTNFKCADLICDFCGYLAQVKTTRLKRSEPRTCPKVIQGAGWKPQSERMKEGIYFSLFVVVVGVDGKASIYFIPRDLQTPEMFKMRNALSGGAKRAGWRGFTIDLTATLAPPVLLGDEGVTEFRL